MVPTVAKQMIRGYIYAYSALSPQTGDCYSIIRSFCNTEVMNEFLKLVSTNYPQWIIIILAKAGWHVSQKMQLPENIRLLHLILYSPENNPVELLWREIRRKYFHSNIFGTLNIVEEILQKALRTYHKTKEKVSSLSKGFLPFLQFRQRFIIRHPKQ